VDETCGADSLGSKLLIAMLSMGPLHEAATVSQGDIDCPDRKTKSHYYSFDPIDAPYLDPAMRVCHEKPTTEKVPHVFLKSLVLKQSLPSSRHISNQQRS